MPAIDVHFKYEMNSKRKEEIINFLCKILSKSLSCGETTIKETDFSIRFHHASGKMDDVEIMIFAHAFEERVKNADGIAKETKEAFVRKFPRLGDVNVSLLLCHYGFSFK